MSSFRIIAYGVTTRDSTWLWFAEKPSGRSLNNQRTAGTDAQRLAAAGIAGYGFMPLGTPAGYDFPSMMHATDERIPVVAIDGQETHALVIEATELEQCLACMQT